jgi:hypothetical protein
VSINDLVKEEINRQIDITIEDIQFEKSKLSTPNARSKFQYDNISDFLLGFTYGNITGSCTWYFRKQLEKTPGITQEETEKMAIKIAKEMNAIVVDRLPEIRQAMSR